MRHRPWIPITALLLALILFFGNRWYRSPEVQQQLRTSVEKTISELIAGDVSIKDMSVGLLSITVSGLDLSIPLNSMNIHVDKIQVGFSLTAFLKRDWEPQELVDRITVVNPHVMITPGSAPVQGTEPPPSIEKLIPFRQATMKGCVISLKQRDGDKLLTIRGLDGEISRTGALAYIRLNGAVGSLRDNFSLSATLSNVVEEQQLSLRLKGVELKELINAPSLKVSGIVDGSLETVFQEGSFPGNIKPDGWLKITSVSVADTSMNFLTQGNMDLLLEDGEVLSRDLSAHIPGGDFSGNLKFTLGDIISGKLEAELNLHGKKKPIPPLTDFTGKIGAVLTFENLHDTAHPLSVTASLVQAGKEYNISGMGLLQPGGVSFRKIRASADFGVVEAELKLLKGVLSLNGESSIDYRLTPSFRLLGKLPFSFEYLLGSSVPKVSADGKELSIISSEGALRLPPLKLQTVNESVTLQGRNEDVSFVGHIADLLRPAEKYRGELKISGKGLPKLVSFMGQKKLIHEGTVSVKVNGEKGVTTIRSGVVLKGEFGEVDLSGSGEWGGQNNSFSIDTGIYRWKNLELPFMAELHEKKKGWQFAFSGKDKHMAGEGLISREFEYLHELNAELSELPLVWLNSFLPEEGILNDGSVSGTVRLSGLLDSLRGEGDLNFSTLSIGSLDSINTRIKLNWKDGRGTVQPFKLNRRRQTIVSAQKTLFGDTMAMDLRLNRIDLGRSLSFLSGDPISGTVSGRIYGADSVISVSAYAPTLDRGELALDSVFINGRVQDNYFHIDSLKFQHNNSKGHVALSYPLSDDRQDTLFFDVSVEGDLLASAGQFRESPIGGHGEGSVSVKGSVSSGELSLEQARLIIPDGEMTVYPFVRGTVKSLYVDVQAFSNDSVDLKVRGEIGRKQAIVKNDYNYSNLKPIKLGDVDLGVLRIFTEEGGVPLFIPGFMENRKGNVGWVEVAGNDSVPHFTLSGTPPDDFLISGTLLLRKTEVTFPLLDDVVWEGDFDPFPFIGFNLDIRAADRSVNYFYRMGDMKKRRSIKMVECTFDPSRTIGVRGRDQDGTFQVVGELRAYKGFLFYGKMFDQNFELGLDFSSGKTEGELYDNMPVIWGSAETYADSSRFERSEVVLMTRNPKDGSLQRRGRLTELVVVPAAGVDEEKSGGEQSADFYLDMFDLEGAGNTLSGIGDRYVNSFVFNYWGRQMARRMGLDMIRLETSLMSNTFNTLYEHQTDTGMTINWSHLALANTGITLGKYVGGDQFLLKMRTQLTPLDTLLIPEYKLGFEYQPLRYLWMDLNYGIKHDFSTNTVQINPEIRLQLRMPFSKFQDAFDRK